MLPPNDTVNADDGVNMGDAVSVGDDVKVDDAVSVRDDVVVDNCDAAAVGAGNIMLVNTSADGVFRANDVPSPSCQHQI